MDGPVHRVISLATALAASACAKAAEGDDGPKRDRVISPRVATLLATAARNAVPAQNASPGAEADVASVPVERAGMERSNSIVRLPSYIVRERRPPAADEVMTKAEREKVAMQKYLGDENGLERSLNMISVAGLWAKIPVLGNVPFIVGQYGGRDAGLPVGPRTNEQRALDQYEKDKIAERWAQLSGLTPPRAVDPATKK